MFAKTGQTKHVNYREIKDDDLLSLQRLMLELGYSVEAGDLRQNVEAILKRGGQVIIAEDGRDVVGSVSIVIDVRLAEGIHAEIVSLVVSSKARGKGIGKGLVKEAEDWAKQKLHKIRVRANEVRKEAHLFYESQGYYQVKTQKVYMKTL
jgi:GNAT superfamily N-acetyltransferase